MFYTGNKVLTAKERIYFNKIGKIRRDKDGMWLAYNNLNDCVAKNNSLAALDKEIQSMERHMATFFLEKEAREKPKEPPISGFSPPKR